MNESDRKEKKHLSYTALQIIGVALFVALNVAWFVPAIDSLRKSVTSVERVTVMHGAMSISRFIENRQSSIEIPARYITAPLASKTNEEVLRKILREDHFTSVTLIDLNGDEVMKFDKAEIISSSSLKNISTDTAFMKTVSTKTHSWSDIKISETLEPSVVLDVPVLSSSGDVIGVIAGQFNFESLFLNSHEVGIATHQVMYAVNSKGLLVSHPDVSLVLQGTSYFERKIVRDVFMEKGVVATSDDAYVYKNENGKEVLAVGAYVPDIDLAVILEEPRDGALGNIWKIQLLFLGTLFLVVGAVISSRYFVKKADTARNELGKTLKEEQELLYDVEVSREQLERANQALALREEKLKSQLEELEALQSLTIGRELKMIELKNELEKCGMHHKNAEKLV